jgi:anti-sigma regulatory factor (Ser/Thr protein kinase)
VAPRQEIDAAPHGDRSALPERGRGVIILRGVFDEVAYSQGADGNRLAVRRRRREVV